MIAVLDNIRSVHNVGSIFRTADAAGIKKIYLAGITATPFDRLGKKRTDFTKVSLGAEDYVLWTKSDSTLKTLKGLKKEGYKIFILEQDRASKNYASDELKKYDFEKVALVLGNEVRGISKKILKIADEIIEIPMRGKKESLNVAVAFGIAAFELARNLPRTTTDRHGLKTL